MLPRFGDAQGNARVLVVGLGERGRDLGSRGPNVVVMPAGGVIHENVTGTAEPERLAGRRLQDVANPASKALAYQVDAWRRECVTLGAAPPVRAFHSVPIGAMLS